MDKCSILGVAAPCGGINVSGAAMNQSSDGNEDISNRMKAESTYISNITSQEIDFIQDTSDYQWFADYSYRDGGSNLRASILSSLSASSYAHNNLDCYNDIARDIDVHLAHADMEDFRTEDIHSLLHTLPQICNSDVQNEQHGEMFASVSGSLMVKYEFDSSISPHNTSQENSNDSAGSLYKSEILFSPVKEVPLISFSTDSLDCEEHDILLTCQANKDNYTIAFEGSVLMDGSTEMQYQHHNESLCSGSISQEGKTSDSSGRSSLNMPSTDTSNSAFNGEKLASNFLASQLLDKLVRSASPYTTWQKLKENSSESIKNNTSGSDNIIPTSSSNACLETSPVTTSCVYLKSQSLPNLNPMKNYLLRHKTQNCISKCRNTFEINSNYLDGCVKLYSLSNSDYRKKNYANVSGTDLISRFMNQKYSKNNPMNCSGSYTFHQSFTRSKEHNFDISSTYKISSEKPLLNSVSEDKPEIGVTTLKENFEDSLVHDKIVENHSEYYNSGYDRSFSSHSGKLHNLKPDAILENENVLTTEEAAKKDKLTKNKSFDSAINFLSERRKSHLACKKYSSSEPSPIQIMDRSIQTSLLIDAEKIKQINSSAPCEINQVSSDKPVYVMYPNYTLPDLSFLRDHSAEINLKNIFLLPQKFSPSPTTEHAPSFCNKLARENEEKKRPCSCPDFDTFKNRDYNHIRDWKSLMFLLPREYSQLLMQMPELGKYLKDNIDVLGRSSLCTSGLAEAKDSPLADCVDLIEPKTTCISSCSTATQPSSGYRGSSTMLLTDSSAGNTPCSPFYMYNKQDGRTNFRTFANGNTDRPPLPRGILRNPTLLNVKSKKNLFSAKRYSMFELREEEKDHQPPIQKRRSLPSQLNTQRKTKDEPTSYSEDEGVESSSSHCESPGPQMDHDARKLEHLLEASMSWNDEDVVQIRNQVNHCLGQNIRKTVSFANFGQIPPNSPNSSVAAIYKPYQMKLQPAFNIPIHEECESAKHSYYDHTSAEQSYWTNSLNYKKELIDAVSVATKRLENSFLQENSTEIIYDVTLNALCPALYAVLNHGLKPTIETAFGDIGNSVWQVIESSSQQGPMTRALHELVLKLNNEDVLTEGLLKFNAFILGLLNVRGLDTWFSYLRTRESILRKHYSDSGLLLSSSRGISSDRQIVDHLLSSLKPVAEFNFKLDLLYECRQLHTSLMQLVRNPEANYETNVNNRTSWVLNKIVRSLQNVTGQSNEQCKLARDTNEAVRPRSCVDTSGGFTFNDIASTVKKRWSGIQFGSKLASAFERLGVDEEDDYTDSLENTPRQIKKAATVSSNSVDDIASVVTESEAENNQVEESVASIRSQGGKFKQLQKKWEMLATERESSENTPSTNNSPLQGISSSNITDVSFAVVKSRIPRPVTSPVRPPSLQFSVAPHLLKKQSPLSPNSSIPTPVTRKSSSSLNVSSKESIVKPKCGPAGRTSRIDQKTSLQMIRPNSLTQRLPPQSSPELKPDNSKKRPSSSLNRSSNSQKHVRTLSHRLPSDNGHLSYNEGEKLRVILEVDDKWLLCCRGDQKGLVPRSAVLPISGHF